MKKKIVSKVFALLLAACTVLSACGNESGNQSVGQTDKSETNDTVQEGEEPYTIVYAFDVWVQQEDWDLVEENLKFSVQGVQTRLKRNDRFEISDRVVN